MNSVKGVSVNTLWTVCQNEQSERSVSMNSLICPSLRSYFVRHIFNTRVLRFCFIRSVNSFCNWVASAIKRKKVLGGSGAQNVSSSELGPLPGWRTDFVHSFIPWMTGSGSIFSDQGFFSRSILVAFFFYKLSSRGLQSVTVDSNTLLLCCGCRRWTARRRSCTSTLPTAVVASMNFSHEDCGSLSHRKISHGTIALMTQMPVVNFSLRANKE